MEKATLKEMLEAGTGMMANLSETITKLEDKGYIESFVPSRDHLSCQSGKIELYPNDIFIDDIFRFENSSDPDDQSILYAITGKNIKGLYVESYGLYHDDLSKAMVDRIKLCRSQGHKSIL